MREQLQTYLDGLIWKKGQFLIDQVMNSSVSSINQGQTMRKAIDTLLAIEPQSCHYEPAHFELFRLAYSAAIEEGRSCSVAFFQALPCHLNTEKNFIKLKIEDNQKIFDRYLFAATGGKGWPQEQFSLEDRFTLLQYVLLQNIPQGLPAKSCSLSTKTLFFMASKQGNFNLEELAIDPSKIEAETRVKINDSWQKMLEYKVAFEEDKQQLISAVVNLGKQKSHQLQTLALGKRSRKV